MSMVKNIVKRIVPYLPPKVAHSILFYKCHGYLLDWSNPVTYDEKMTWSLANLFGRDEAIYADKYRAREIVKNAGFEELLTEIYGVWENAGDINFKELPQKFVLKTNNGSGAECIEICHDKSKLNEDKIRKKFDKALKFNLWKYQCEYHYRYIEPLIFAEELLDDHREERMIDYKIHCFNGEPKCILVCSNRACSLKLDYYDLEWNYLDVVPEHLRSGKKIVKPSGLKKMIAAAEKLSSGFPAARIDFYDVEGKVYFGEITLSPAGGDLYYVNDKWQHIFGDLMDISCCDKSFVKKFNKLEQ